MADCFISYRRTPSAPIAMLLQEKLENEHGIDAYVDTTRTDGSRVQFPQRLMQAIQDAPVFICILGDRDGQHTLESEWVTKEIERAHELGKFCIPVFQESYTPVDNPLQAVNYLLNHDGIHIFDQKNIMVDNSVAAIADLIKPHRIRRNFSRLLFLLIALAIVLLVIASVILLVQDGSDDGDSNDDEATQTVIALAEINTELPELTFTEQPVLTSTDEPIFTQEPSVTPTDEPTSTPTLSPEQIAMTPVASNGDWTPYERDFNEVTMVLVPVGCFMMGSDDGALDEQPAHEQCFDDPFWIDKTEITRAQYQTCVDATVCEVVPRSSYSIESDQPVNRITWFQTQAYCEWRGGRLPTEREWEYSARGVDNLSYPWGNEFIPDNVVFRDNSNNETVSVGIRPLGASWVGALDMAGNVWEWTSSLYNNYPYTEVFEINNDDDSQRVLRGGSFLNGINDLGSSDRFSGNPTDLDVNFGFRCARDFDG